ncbi:uncharacterized protein LOC132204453 [Neocloeon triangulifer]|uniref:uncharacterized protein LOC132204353 n=1 Tax=Neocloeon triangulifer TaxID=2078957 RepID=UPI00286F42E1|nr:uncharacterized protein LOC132204353 [Neocloeon triangulifer]XP_059488948.1 uncharacterized protein LOC132204453 [Neocloeon triangulifer]
MEPLTPPISPARPAQNNVDEVKVKVEPVEEMAEEPSKPSKLDEAMEEDFQQSSRALDFSMISSISGYNSQEHSLASADTVYNGSSSSSSRGSSSGDESSSMDIKNDDLPDDPHNLRILHTFVELDLLPREVTGIQETAAMSLVDLEKLVTFKEKFFNLGDEKTHAGHLYDVENCFFRQGLPALYETTYCVPGSVDFHMGFLILYNKKNHNFELKFYLRVGERQIIVTEFQDFYRMLFSTDLATLEKDYGEFILFENIVGKVKRDAHNCDWLILYQVWDNYHHRLGVDNEPFRIVMSERQHTRLQKTMITEMHVSHLYMKKLTASANICMSTAIGLAYNGLKMKCKGCRQNNPYDHICRTFEFSRTVHNALGNELERLVVEDKDHFQCEIYGRLLKLVKSEYSLRDILSEMLVNDNGLALGGNMIGGRIPGWVSEFKAPSSEYIRAKYRIVDYDMIDGADDDDDMDL